LERQHSATIVVIPIQFSTVLGGTAVKVFATRSRTTVSGSLVPTNCSFFIGQSPEPSLICQKRRLAIARLFDSVPNIDAGELIYFPSAFFRSSCSNADAMRSISRIAMPCRAASSRQFKSRASRESGAVPSDIRWRVKIVLVEEAIILLSRAWVIRRSYFASRRKTSQDNTVRTIRLMVRMPYISPRTHELMPPQLRWRSLLPLPRSPTITAGLSLHAIRQVMMRVSSGLHGRDHCLSRGLARCGVTRLGTRSDCWQNNSFRPPQCFD
jgi:hypothetical protein